MQSWTPALGTPRRQVLSQNEQPPTCPPPPVHTQPRPISRVPRPMHTHACPAGHSHPRPAHARTSPSHECACPFTLPTDHTHIHTSLQCTPPPCTSSHIPHTPTQRYTLVRTAPDGKRPRSNPHGLQCKRSFICSHSWEDRGGM